MLCQRTGVREAVDEFRKLMDESREEHNKTTGGQVDIELRTLNVVPNRKNWYYI